MGGNSKWRLQINAISTLSFHVLWLEVYEQFNSAKHMETQSGDCIDLHIGLCRNGIAKLLFVDAVIDCRVVCFVRTANAQIVYKQCEAIAVSNCHIVQQSERGDGEQIACQNQIEYIEQIPKSNCCVYRFEDYILLDRGLAFVRISVD